MADANVTTGAAQEPSAEASARELEGGSYEVIRARLDAHAKTLGERAEQLNAGRIAAFGGTEMSIIGQCRVRTENNCVPRDIVQVGGRLLFGYNVFIGLRTETALEDVFSLQRWNTGEEGLELAAVPLPDGGPKFLAEPGFVDQFRELYRFYKTARLLQLSRNETKLLAVFQIGADVSDVRVFRWALDARGEPTYVDNRGERDFAFPPSHDFEWRATTREDRREGRHPHVSIRDKVFVETVGGDLTVKIENNTETGEGIYAEPVDEPQQSLDDAQIEYAEIGPLILLRIRPYREDVVRHLVFSTRTQRVVRIDAIGRACVSLPEDHGIIFPGGFFLQDGQNKVFDGDFTNFEFFKVLRSPNGEDVLYVFVDRQAGHYVLLPYNLIRREIQTPVRCNGFSLFDDGKMVVFRTASDEPTKVHPMQVWQTPFVSAEHAAATPTGGGFLHKLGNADLVRGISDCLSVRRFVQEQTPSRQIYEDLIATVTRIIDAYHWLGHAEAYGMAGILGEIRRTAELIVDEFEKVVALRKQAATALGQATKTQNEILSSIRPDSWTAVAEFMEALARLRTQRGALITLRELRYIDLPVLAKLEEEVTRAFTELSANTVRFLARDESLRPITRQLDELLERVGTIEKTNELVPHVETLGKVSDGLAVLSEVAANLQVDDPTLRTRILEGVSEAFAHCNRVRAVLENRRKELLSHEGKAEFVAQFKLYGQSVQSAIALCDTPERCDEQSSRLMVQLEELEARFSEFDEFVGELTRKREEVYEAFGQRKQMLVDERQRRVANLWQAAERIIAGLSRRASSFANADELNAFFASDGMVLKLRELGERIAELGDSVKSDEVQSRLKSARQDALRGMRDRLDLFEGGADLIKLGKHRFTVNTQPIELTIVPHEGGMALGVTGTDFVEPIVDAEFDATRPFWNQQIVSETEDVYRGEYLAASVLADAEAGVGGLSIAGLDEALRSNALLEVVRKYAADRYQEGYDRGVHDADAAAILGKLVTLRHSAGLLRFSAEARTAALLHWAYCGDARRQQWHRRAMSLLRLRGVFSRSDAVDELASEIATSIRARIETGALPMPASVAELAARYLVEELAAASPRFVVSADAVALRDGLLRRLDEPQGEPGALDRRRSFEEDLQALADDPVARFELAQAWLAGWVASSTDPDVTRRAPAIVEAAGLIAIDTALDREPSSGLTWAEVPELLGQHPRITGRKLELRIDEFGGRLDGFRRERVPAFLRYRELRSALVERERGRLRLGELRPKVLTSFVRNRLVDEVYLPLVGDNLAKQLGAAGEGKRTDLMGMLLLISPPGYGKTTLMEYVASRFGLAFVKVNGPALGHAVTSIDPNDAPNATARQEVEKINLAFEMGNNVMLYLDDIQHTNPELLQKFISLCDAQRRIEGVWKGRTRTYDLRGKKFCVVMAGNPYTESGDKFQIPDMLANRADTYNLGDILQGKDDLFALSYIENAVTSNRVLAPLATREPADLHKLVRLAQGEEVPTTELSQSYSAVEIGEITAVLQRLFKVQRVLLEVNRQYIASASMDDRFRTEPPFKLQGSYRNMNKLAEKVVPALDDDELERLVDDHYASESQTLTTGAEHNLLKLAELRGRMTDAAKARWEAIRREFQRLKMVGGSDEDPVARVTAGLANLGEGLRGIEAAMGTAATAASKAAGGIKFGDIEAHLYGIQQSIAAAASALAKQAAVKPGPVPTVEPTHRPTDGGHRDDLLAGYLDRLDRTLKTLASPKFEIEVHNQAPPGIEELLAQQIAIIERTLVPLVRTTNQSMGNPTAVDLHVQELLRLMRAIDERLRAVVMGPAPQR